MGVTDAARAQPTASFTITVGVPAGPPATITGLPATATPATQPALGIGIPSAYPLDITGTVTLTFAPDSPSPDGQEVVFTTGGRTASFTVAANSTQVVFTGGTPGVQIGTVSGTITLTLKLTAAGIDVTPSPAPSTTMIVAKSAPFIKTATVTGVTSSGFNLVVVGYATSREMVSATVGFTAASGVTLASSTATVSLATVFTTWYQNSASAAYGSNFSLTIPFTFTNSTTPADLRLGDAHQLAGQLDDGERPVLTTHLPDLYDEVPYPSLPRPQSHPARIAALAAIAGMTPPPVGRWRVLEIGCGDA